MSKWADLVGKDSEEARKRILADHGDADIEIIK